MYQDLRRTKAQLIQVKMEKEQMRAMNTLHGRPEELDEKDMNFAKLFDSINYMLGNIDQQIRAIRPHLTVEPFLFGLTDLQRQVVIGRYCGEGYKPLADCLHKNPASLRVIFHQATKKISENLNLFKAAVKQGLTKEQSFLFLKLNPTERRVFPFFLQGVCSESIAQELQLDAKKVWQAVSRIRKKLPLLESGEVSQ
jgi:DNA-directed RNA polymerase specialized sigma24 family protein